MQTDFDILIVGGGLVGASLACALRGGPLAVGVVEAVAPAVADRPGYDDRTLALAYGSRRILEGMGVWAAVAARGAAPIKRIHISDRGRFGFTRLHAEDAGLEALGYVVAAPVLGAALYEALRGATNISLICPATVEAVATDDRAAQARVRMDGAEHTLTARLIVAADGTDSPIRAAAGIAAQRVDYGQSAIVSAVTPSRAHAWTAYERFTDSGPLALLPAGAEHCAVVWTVAADRVETMLGWDDETFRVRLQECFGERLGRLEGLGRRRAYPLSLIRVREHVRPRLALIGNAAHSVHPVAGQGFNLGLRDAAALSEVLLEGAAAGADIDAIDRLRRYAAWRERDNRMTATLTHSLVRVFSNDYLPVACARNFGLIAVDLLPPLKRGLIRGTSGLAGRLPRLARGLPARGSRS